MPTYEYLCIEHGKQEVYQDINDIHEAKCSVCDKLMRRIYGFSGIQIKGNHTKMGNTRGELYANLEAEGLAPKGFANHDKHTYKAV
jgi:putative FmdB family regulatory protein